MLRVFRTLKGDRDKEAEGAEDEKIEALSCLLTNTVSDSHQITPSHFNLPIIHQSLAPPFHASALKPSAPSHQPEIIVTFCDVRSEAFRFLRYITKKNEAVAYLLVRLNKNKTSRSRLMF